MASDARGASPRDDFAFDREVSTTMSVLRLKRAILAGGVALLLGASALGLAFAQEPATPTPAPTGGISGTTAFVILVAAVVVLIGGMLIFRPGRHS